MPTRSEVLPVDVHDLYFDVDTDQRLPAHPKLGDGPGVWQRDASERRGAMGRLRADD